MKHIRFLVFLSLALLVPCAAFAQSSNGAINGNVADNSGSTLPGVTVTATNVATAATRTAVTNGAGHYEIPLLIPGTYRVAGELSGFQPVKFDNVVVNVGTTVTLDFKMKPGVAETVTVTAAAPVIETTKSEVSSVVNEKAIENLPVNGRNFIDFVLTTPGVVRDPRSGDISFAGQRGTLNSIVVDGADNNNTFFGQSLGRTGSGRAPYQFSQDAVKEFQVNANGYSPEYGRAGGAVINVITRSGTNDVDGSLFEFYRDKKYRSLDYLQALRRDNGLAYSVSPYHFNQFGGSLGGPIVRDKHFFFANVDEQRNSIPNETVLGGGPYPTDAASQATLALLAARAIPYSQNQNQTVYLLKTDSEVTGTDHLSFRYNRQNFTGVNFENGGLNSAPEHTGDSLVKTDTLSLVNTTIFSGALFNEVRAQYAKDREPGLANSDQPEATVRQAGTTVLVIGRNSFSPRETTINRHQLADTVTFVTGPHTVKGGFDYNKDNILNFFPGNFSGVYTFNNLSDFPNKPATYLQNFPGAGTDGGTTHPDLTDIAFFAGDEWRVNPSLTVNAGLRYDRQNFAQPKITNPDAALLAAGLDTGRIHEDNNNYGPRLGFAWTPGDGRSVLHGGYGIFYGRTPAIMIGTGHSQNGIQVLSINFPSSLFPTWPNRYDTLPSSLASLPQNIFVFAPDFQNPKVQQSSLGFERALSGDVSFGVTYQHVQGSDLPRTADINIGTPTTQTIGLFDSTGKVQTGTATYTRYTSRPFPNFNRVLEFESNGHSRYNGLTLDLQKRFSSNWQARIAYTYAKAMDDHPDATIVVPGVDDPREAQDALNIGDEWAYADTDVRHRVVLSGVWNLAYADRIQNSFAHAVLSGWTLSAIVSYQSGQPFTAVVNGDLNNDGNRSNDRAPGVGRNTLRLPSQTSIDPRLTKEINLFRSARLQLIAEAFNLTNRSDVTRERNTIYNLVGSGATAQLNAVSTNPVSGYLSPSAVLGPRTYQFAAKVLF